MKTILLCIVASILSVSCTSDSDSISGNTAVNNQAIKSDRDYPTNPLNPFDAKGYKIYEALSGYYQEHHYNSNISDLTEQIKFISEKLEKKAGMTKRLIPFTDEMVQSIMEDPDNSMIIIVENSTLRTSVKMSLISFLQHLIINRQEQFHITFEYIVEYEAQVLNNTVFTLEETETILTIASISRYSLYSEEERKDKDWDILKGNKPVKTLFGAGQVPIISIIALLNTLI